MLAEKAQAKQAAALAKLEKAITTQGIIPDVIPDSINFIPKYELNVKFPSGKKCQLGKELSSAACLSAPTVTWPADPDAFYTIICVDPDAPTREKPTQGEIRHWLVANIPGSDVYNGEDLTDWIEPQPESGTGLHRIVFLLFKQKGRQELPVIEGKRSGFNAAQWAKRKNMTLEAANWFQTLEK
ncbi:phosphatidylethanolamine binding protein [Phlyctochytrium arcticum]|nr:phosphatidylethanolamine binding protein [Phlyctochytrium arcticum]